MVRYKDGKVILALKETLAGKSHLKKKFKDMLYTQERNPYVVFWWGF